MVKLTVVRHEFNKIVSQVECKLDIEYVWFRDKDVPQKDFRNIWKKLIDLVMDVNRGIKQELGWFEACPYLHKQRSHIFGMFQLFANSVSKVDIRSHFQLIPGFTLYPPKACLSNCNSLCSTYMQKSSFVF